MNVRSQVAYTSSTFAVCNTLELPEIKNRGEKECGDFNSLSGRIFCTDGTSGVMKYKRDDNFGCGLNSCINVPRRQ